MTALKIAGVTKAFGAVQVLRGVDLSVDGGVTAVLGASGDGKTTLLRVIAGFIRPDAGTIQLGDDLVVGNGTYLPAQKRKVGFVPQEGALFPHRSVAANITFGLPAADRRGPRLQEMLDLVELPASIADRFPHELSGGQQQRVALARALAPRPDVVLLDEPFSSLDASLREGTGRAVVRALRAASTTAVLVTHDQGEALSLSDQVAVMRQGRLVQVDSPVSMYNRPVDPAVATFMGGATVLPARVRGPMASCALGDVVISAGQVQGDGVVVVRPEQIVPTTAQHGVRATVVDVSYYGHDATVRMRLGEDGPVVVSRFSHVPVPSSGDEIHVTVTGTALAFPAES
jgi:iron(III) transport system ATP-binding protein